MPIAKKKQSKTQSKKKSKKTSVITPRPVILRKPYLISLIFISLGKFCDFFHVFMFFIKIYDTLIEKSVNLVSLSHSFFFFFTELSGF